MSRPVGLLLGVGLLVVVGGCPHRVGSGPGARGGGRETPPGTVHEVGVAQRTQGGKTVRIGFVRRGVVGGKGTLLVLGGPHCMSWFGLHVERHYQVVYFSPAVTSLLLSQRIADVEAVRRAVGASRVYVFGHSENGAVALEYAAAHSGRVAGLIWVAGLSDHARSLSLELSMLARAASEPDLARRYESLAARKQHSVLDLILSLQSRKLGSKCHQPERCRRAFVRAGAALRKLGYHRALGRSMTRARISPRDRVAALVKLDLHGYSFLDYQSRRSARALRNVRILMIHGSLDTIVHPETGRALHRHLPGARLVELAQSGHLPFLEQPHKFRRELRAFLGVPVREAPVASPLGASWKPPYATAGLGRAQLDQQARAALMRQAALRADALLAVACRLYGPATGVSTLRFLRETVRGHREFLRHHCQLRVHPRVR